MDFTDYIKSNFSSHANPRSKETSDVYSNFQALGNMILGDFSQKVIVVNEYTTSVYPKYIQLNNRHYILWDSCYWDLYGRYLYVFHMFFSDPFIINSKFVEQYFTSLGLLFLSCRFEKYPSLAYLLSEKYNSSYKLVPPFNEGEDIDDILSDVQHSSDLYFAKFFGFCHELTHIKARTTDIREDEIYKQMLNICEYYQKLLELHLELSDNPDERKKIISELDIINALLIDTNTTLIEEVYCDVLAICVIYVSLMDIDDNKDKNLFNLSKIKYLSIFQWWLKSIEGFWDVLSRVYREPYKHDAAFVDQNNPFFQFGEKLNIESNARGDIVWNIVEKLLKIDTTDLDESLFYQKPAHKILKSADFTERFVPILQNSMGFSFIDEILNRYTTTKKGFWNNESNIIKRNKLIGWVNRLN